MVIVALGGGGGDWAVVTEANKHKKNMCSGYITRQNYGQLFFFYCTYIIQGWKFSDFSLISDFFTLTILKIIFAISS